MVDLTNIETTYSHNHNKEKITPKATKERKPRHPDINREDLERARESLKVYIDHNNKKTSVDSNLFKNNITAEKNLAGAETSLNSYEQGNLDLDSAFSKNGFYAGIGDDLLTKFKSQGTPKQRTRSDPPSLFNLFRGKTVETIEYVLHMAGEDGSSYNLGASILSSGLLEVRSYKDDINNFQYRITIPRINSHKKLPKADVVAEVKDEKQHIKSHPLILKNLENRDNYLDILRKVVKDVARPTSNIEANNVSQANVAL